MPHATYKKITSTTAEIINLITLPPLPMQPDTELEVYFREQATFIQKTLNESASRMRQAFEEEKRAMRQAFREELQSLKDSNAGIMEEIVKGLAQLQEGVAKANLEMEAKFTVEFAKEVSRQLNATQGVSPQKDKKQSLSSLKDLGSYLSVADKR